MADNNKTRLVDTGARKKLVDHNSGLIEEVQMLRQHTAEMYQAWMTGTAPPLPPPSCLDATFLQTWIIVSNDPPYSPDAPAYTSFPNHPRSSVTCPPTIPNNENLLRAHDIQYYPVEVAHKVFYSHKQSLQDEPHVENEKITGKEGRNGIPQRLEGVRQSLKNKQGMRNQGNIACKELFASPDVRLPAGFKVPKFNLYDGYGDPVAHLRVCCSEMRGLGEKDDLLIAYFSKIPTGAALDWYTRQDISK